jgi:hypothetical protein
VHPESNEKDSVFKGLINSVIATMRLQRATRREDFQKLIDELKELFKDERQKQKFATFMTFMFRLLENRLDKDEYQNVRDLNEVIKMTYTFIDYEIDNGRKEGRKEGEKKGEFNTIYNFIKKGRITIEEAASDIGISVEQLLEGFKEYNLVL